LSKSLNNWKALLSPGTNKQFVCLGVFAWAQLSTAFRFREQRNGFKGLVPNLAVEMFRLQQSQAW
jgi:hypothetical protein